MEDVVSQVQQMTLAVFGAVIVLGTMLVITLFHRRGGRKGLQADREAGHYLVDMLFLYLLVVALYVGGGGLLQSIHELWGLVAGQLLFLLVPALVAPAILGHNAKRTLGVVNTKGLWFVGAAALGMAAWIPLGLYMAGQELIMPMPPGYEEAFAEQVMPKSTDEWLGTILAFALLPGICEELLFRGAILGLVKKELGPIKALLLSSMLFGLLHLEPFRIMPTALLGLALGYVTLHSGSILPAMLLHFVHNSTLLTMGLFLDVSSEEEAPLWLVTSGFISLLIAGLTWYQAGVKNEPFSVGDSHPPPLH